MLDEIGVDGFDRRQVEDGGVDAVAGEELSRCEAQPGGEAGAQQGEVGAVAEDVAFANFELVAGREQHGRETIVVFLSDNGATSPGTNTPFRGWKGQLWEGGIRVPCMVRWAGRIPAGQVSAQVAINIDITATLLAAAGAAPQTEFLLDGVDLTSVLTRTEPEFERTVFFRYKRLERRRLAVMTGDRKYVWENGEKWLVDLQSDPAEEHNLIADHPAEAAHFEALLVAWQEAVRAPRLAAKPEDQVIVIE